MKLGIVWDRPIVLKNDRHGSLHYMLELDRLPQSAGIYVFARRWSTSFEALYVGQSQNLRGRIKGHLNNLTLMRHLHESKSGKRLLLTCRILTRPGQRMSKCMDIVEKTLILHFLSLGHDLVNKQGIKIRRHQIDSDGAVPRRFMPSTLYLRE